MLRLFEKGFEKLSEEFLLKNDVDDRKPFGLETTYKGNSQQTTALLEKCH